MAYFFLKATLKHTLTAFFGWTKFTWEYWLRFWVYMLRVLKLRLWGTLIHPSEYGVWVLDGKQLSSDTKEFNNRLITLFDFLSSTDCKGCLYSFQSAAFFSKKAKWLINQNPLPGNTTWLTLFANYRKIDSYICHLVVKFLLQMLFFTDAR